MSLECQCINIHLQGREVSEGYHRCADVSGKTLAGEREPQRRLLCDRMERLVLRSVLTASVRTWFRHHHRNQKSGLQEDHQDLR